MSLSTLKTIACGIHPAAGANGSPSGPSKVKMMNTQAPPSLQVKEKEQVRSQESLSSTSRREMMHLTAASVGLLSLLLPASAEARPRNATMRQKIMEKFEELREKAGLSKPKDGVESKSKIQDGAKETKPEDEKKHTSAPEKSTAHSTEGPSVPALPSIINGSGETTLP